MTNVMISNDIVISDIPIRYSRYMLNYCGEEHAEPDRAMPPRIVTRILSEGRRGRIRRIVLKKF